MPKIAFITNFCPHYRIRLFERIAKEYDMDFLFYSEGKEWYWQLAHGINEGNFHSIYLPGFWLGKTRITPSLPWKILRGKYDVIIKCINGKFALPMTFLVTKLMGKPFILYTGIWMRIPTRLQRLVFPLTRYIYCHADAIVVYGAHVKQYLITEGVDPERIFIAPHAVDNAAYQQKKASENTISLRNELSISSDQKVILYLGRLERMKGLPYLIEAFERLNLPDTILIIAGSGTMEAQLRSMVAERNLSESVRFIGYIPVDQTTAIYDIADVFVLPSITGPDGKEPWGLTINEVFNRGLPVVVTDAVGAAQGGLVEDGVNGLIVPEQNAEALTEAFKRLLMNDALRIQMGQNARAKMNAWTIEEMADGFFDAIQFVRPDLS